MRAIPTSWRELIFRSDVAVAVRVLVASKEDPHGNTIYAEVPEDRIPLVDLTPYSSPNLTCGRGYNWVRSVEWSNSKDASTATATVSLFREQDDGISLSPDIPGLANGQITVPEDAAVWIDRRIQILVQLVPDSSGAIPSNGAAIGDWLTVFDGFIDTIDTGEDDRNVLTVTARDQGAALLDYWVVDTVPQIHKNASPDPSPDWFDTFISGLTNYQADLVAFLNALIAGTYNRDQHDNPAAPWKFPAVELKNPQGLAITVTMPGGDKSQDPAQSPFVPQQQLLTAIQSRLIQFGWYCGYKWSESTSRFELTVWAPGKFIPANPTTEQNSRSYEGPSLPEGGDGSITFTLEPSLYKVKSNKRDLSTVRNRISVPYQIRTAAAGEMTSNGKHVVDAPFVEQPDSKNRYGYRSMRLDPDTTGFVQEENYENASKNMLRDLCQPWQLVDFETVPVPFAELGDCIQLNGTNRHWTDNVWVGLDSFSHRIEGGKATSSLKGRKLWVVSGAYQTDPTSSDIVTSVFGISPSITEGGEANNFGIGLHPKHLYFRGVGAGLSAAGGQPAFEWRMAANGLVAGYNATVAAESSGFVVFERVERDTSNSFVINVSDGHGHEQTQWCCPTTALYEISLSFESAGSIGFESNIQTKSGTAWPTAAFDGVVLGGAPTVGPVQVHIPGGTLLRVVVQTNVGTGSRTFSAGQWSVRRVG